MILVTGGTGLIGAHLLLLLTEKEERVRAIYRSEAKVDLVRKLFSENPGSHFDAIEWIAADILDVPSLEMAFQGITKVYHCAGFISFDPTDYKSLRKVNIGGTANVVNLCVGYRIEKLCYVSSIAVLGKMQNGKCADETVFWNPEAENNIYAIAKYGAEMEVWRATQEGIPVVIVNPGIVLGEGFPDSPSSGFFKMVKKGLTYYPPGSTGFVDVKDVTKAMQKGTESVIKNERFILVGENAKYKTVLCKIAEELHVAPPQKQLKKWQLDFLWRLDGLLSVFPGRKRKLTRNGAHSLWNDSCYSNEKIKKALQFNFKPIDHTIARISKSLKWE